MEVNFQTVLTFNKSMVFKQFRHNACDLRFMMFGLALKAARLIAKLAARPLESVIQCKKNLNGVRQCLAYGICALPLRQAV